MGAAGIVVFLVTGQYMHHVLDHLRDMADGPRMLYRSAHIYLLLISLTNLALGNYLMPQTSQIRRIAQYITSIALILTPFVIVFGFFFESNLTNLGRPYTNIGLYGMFAVGVILILLKIGVRRKMSHKN
jgi:ABC-type Na+ efflux pump permease subunit